MIDEKAVLRQEFELGNIEQMLKSLDVPCSLIARSELVPISAIYVPMEPDQRERSRGYGLSFIPMDEDDMDNSSLLQLYYEFPFEFNSKYELPLLKYINACNLLQPLGNFGIKDDQKFYFRYILIVGKDDDLNKDMLLDTLMMFEYLISIYEDQIDDLNSGELTLEAALEELNDY
jgi:Putative bacterial sensory transduction regulator